MVAVAQCTWLLLGLALSQSAVPADAIRRITIRRVHKVDSQTETSADNPQQGWQQWPWQAWKAWIGKAGAERNPKNPAAKAGRGDKFRTFVQNPTLPAASEGKVGTPFRTMQYNILAKDMGVNSNPWFLYPLNLNETERGKLLEAYATKDAQGKWSNTFANGFGGLLTEEQRKKIQSNDQYFRWEQRKDLVKKEILSAAPDIISLVENDVYEEVQTWLPSYKSSFVKRPHRRSTDGSSIFWRDDRFELLGERGLAFNELKEDGTNRRPDRTLAAVALRDRTDGRVLVVASAHLMKEPDNKENDMNRTMEISQMMTYVTQMVYQHSATGFLIMGDFNAIRESRAYQFMLSKWPTCDPAVAGVGDAFVSFKDQKAFCTSSTSTRRMWIDYIFYSNTSLQLANTPELVGCPSEPIPDATHGSDHLPILANLQFTASPGIYQPCS